MAPRLDKDRETIVMMMTIIAVTTRGAYRASLYLADMSLDVVPRIRRSGRITRARSCLLFLITVRRKEVRSLSEGKARYKYHQQRRN